MRWEITKRRFLGVLLVLTATMAVGIALAIATHPKRIETAPPLRDAQDAGIITWEPRAKEAAWFFPRGHRLLNLIEKPGQQFTIELFCSDGQRYEQRDLPMDLPIIKTDYGTEVVVMFQRLDIGPAMRELHWQMADARPAVSRPAKELAAQMVKDPRLTLFREIRFVGKESKLPLRRDICHPLAAYLKLIGTDLILTARL